MTKPIFGSQTASAIAALIAKEPKDVAETVTQMRGDYQVKLAELTLSSNAKSAKVTVSADDSDPRAQALAEQLTQLWYKSLKDMLECVAYGRQAFEKVWEYDEESQLSVIRKLVPLPFDGTEMLHDKGEFTGVELKGKSKGDTVTLDPLYCWWLALDAKPLNPYGTSRFLGAPWNVFNDRKQVLKLRQDFVTKFIFGGGIVHAPDTVVVDGEEVETMPLLQAAWNDVKAGGFFRLPIERALATDGSPTGPYLWDFSSVSHEMKSAQPLLDVIAGMDAEQLLAFGIPPKTVIEGDAVGSFALVTQQMLILLSVVEDIVNQAVESFQSYVADPAAEMNGLRKITVNFMPLTKSPDDLGTELVKSWLTTPQLSPLLISGAVDIAAVFEAVGVPISSDAVERLKAMIAKLGTQAVVTDTAAAVPAATAPEAAPENMATAPSNALNGAQITSSIDVMLRVKNGDISAEAGAELLQAVGIEEQRAKRMMSTIRVTPGAVSLAAPDPFRLGTR